MILVVSTLFLSIVFKISPGEYKGDKLIAYLTKKIAKDVGVEYDESSIVVDKQIESDGVLALCGCYMGDKSNGYVNCFVYLFERKHKKFWNALVGTEPDYEISLGVKSINGINYNGLLVCDECYFLDINGDDKNEALFFYRTWYADRIVDIPIVLQNHDGVWDMISPDFSDLMSIIKIDENVPDYIKLEKYDFSYTNNDGKYSMVVYGQYHNGKCRVVDNPIWGAFL